MTELQAKIRLQCEAIGWHEKEVAQQIFCYLGAFYSHRFKLAETSVPMVSWELLCKYKSRCFEFKQLHLLGTKTDRGQTTYRYLLYNWKKR